LCNALDFRFGEHVSVKPEFCGAGLTVPGGDSPNGTAVQGRPLGVVRKFLVVSQVPLLVVVP
jgi:hypothetical protein